MNAIYIPTQTAPPPLQPFCALIKKPTTEESITNYKRLAKDLATGEVWTTASGKE